MTPVFKEFTLGACFQTFNKSKHRGLTVQTVEIKFFPHFSFPLANVFTWTKYLSNIFQVSKL
jgi:hypothetical protein